MRHDEKHGQRLHEKHVQTANEHGPHRPTNRYDEEHDDPGDDRQYEKHEHGPDEHSENIPAAQSG